MSSTRPDLLNFEILGQASIEQRSFENRPIFKEVASIIHLTHQITFQRLMIHNLHLKSLLIHFLILLLKFNQKNFRYCFLPSFIGLAEAAIAETNQCRPPIPHHLKMAIFSHFNRCDLIFYQDFS